MIINIDLKSKKLVEIGELDAAGLWGLTSVGEIQSFVPEKCVAIFNASELHILCVTEI